jgi:hypothetical protein
MSNMITHAEWLKLNKPARPCTAHDITFGGACFNCGYDPAKLNPVQKRVNPFLRFKPKDGTNE